MKTSHYKHHSHSPSVLAEDHCTVSVSNSFFVGLKGPAFAASTESKVTFTDSLVQFAELGGECVFCDFVSKRSTWTHFASAQHHEDNFLLEFSSSSSSSSLMIPYEDNDNDGLYLSGGSHLVQDSVIARTHDDGIDSGISEHPLVRNNNNKNRKKSSSSTAPKNSGGAGGGNINDIKISNTIIEDVFHEGIAFSSTPAGHRHAQVDRVLIQRTQQALEMGYSSKFCTAEITNSVLKNNQVGLRFGDNYYQRDQEGFISCVNCTFQGNDVNVVNFVRKLGSPHYHHHRIDTSDEDREVKAKITIKNSKFSEKTTKVVARDQFHCRDVFETFYGEGNQRI